MIISLAEKCSEGCSHCFINSLPRSPIMSEETLDQTIKFLQWTRNKMVLISGGEFTEHPLFFEYINRIIDEARKPYGLPVLLLSNGSWFFDEEKKEKVKKLLERKEVLLFQVRTHPKFYTNYERTWDAKSAMEALSPKLQVFNDGIRLVPLGRALANHKGEYEYKTPPCANVFLLAKQVARSFRDVLLALDAKAISCKPFVSSQGNIHAGETPFCEILGTVWQDDQTIFKNILTQARPKNKCGLVGNLPEQHRNIIYS